MPAGAPIISGKAAIRDYVTQSFATPGFKISWKTLDATVSDDGTMGYTTAESTITFPGADGQPVTETGRGVAVWRRDPSGAWKCVYDAWNHGPEIGAVHPPGAGQYTTHLHQRGHDAAFAYGRFWQR